MNAAKDETVIRFEEEHDDIREMVAGFSDNELSPRAEATDENAEFPEASLAELAEIGLLGAMVSEAHGGGGSDVRTLAILLEELARGCASTALCLSSHSLAAMAIAANGSDEQCGRLLPKLATGEALATFAVSEQGPDGLPSRTRLTAALDGDRYQLTGQHRGVVFGDRADAIVIAARVGETEDVGLFVAARSDGVTVTPLETRLGLRGAGLALVEFAGSDAERLGTGDDRVASTLNRIANAALLHGLGRMALDYARGYASERVAFGRTIDRFQALQMKMAESRAMLDATGLLVYRAATLHDGSKDSTQVAMSARITAAKSAYQVCKDAIQILGGNGFSREYPVERAYRDALAISVLDGSNDSHRLSLATQMIGA